MLKHRKFFENGVVTVKQFSTKSSFWIVAWVLAISLWGSAAPSMEFPEYAAQWHLSKSVTTGIFSIYPILLIMVLFLLGNISDRIGRKKTLLIGLAFLLIGGLFFALAPNVYWLFGGRMLQGVGVGLTLGAGAAALVEFNPYANQKIAGSVNTISQALGIFIATCGGASLIKYAPFPLHFSYWVFSAFVLLSIVLCLFLPRAKTGPIAAAGRWKPQGVKVPPGLWGIYSVAALAIGASFGTVAIFISLGAQIARDIIGTQDILVIGAFLSISYLIMAASAVVAGKLRPMISIQIGLCSIVLTMVLLISAAELHLFIVFILASIFCGLSHGFAGTGAIGLAAINTPERYRVQFLSAVLVVAYLFQGGSAFGAGVTSTVYGFGFAIALSASIIALIALLALFLTLKGRRQRDGVPAA
ncbi:MFS transporter [Paenibacillus sp. GCM10023250]|uniref:MFS transporter n=1 Tax=Paenibacillus sp. GCM10023250 TaxID=3252648 RepID=UPI00360C3F86